jgi:hypothetical protein
MKMEFSEVGILGEARVVLCHDTRTCPQIPTRDSVSGFRRIRSAFLVMAAVKTPCCPKNAKHPELCFRTRLTEGASEIELGLI